MNTKPLLLLTCFVAVMLVASAVTAGPRPRRSNHVASMPARSGGARLFAGNRFGTWNGQHWSGRTWNTARWNNWNWHHRNLVFVDFGFPFWGWWGYPSYYGYYPYGCYPYGYYGAGYYGGGYYGGSGYNYGNVDPYNNSYGYGNQSSVAELQRKLAAAGYYHGPIDGIMGSRTYYALRAYRHDHGNGDVNPNNHRDYPTQSTRPYSPPPITTEPSPNE